MTEVTGGRAVIDALVALDVRHVFGIVSVHNLPIFEALRQDGRIRVVPTRHEQGAVHAADGYARATGRLGVALTSTGPGAANAMGGLYEAAYASSRVLMLTGQIPTTFRGRGWGYMHEADGQPDMLRSVCGSFASVQLREQVDEAVMEVARSILTGRPRPGAVEIPIDIQSAAAPRRLVTPRPVPRPPLDDDGLERAAQLLRTARRPLVWAGGGVNIAGANAVLEQLVTRLGAPTLTTANGRGAIPEDHTLALGPNTEMEALAPIIHEADVVLAIGTRFQSVSTVQQAMQLPGELIHIDVDPAVLGRRHRTTVPVVGDAVEAVDHLVELLAGHGPVADEEFVARARRARDTVESQTREAMGPDHDLMERAIRRVLPRDALLVKDATIAAYVWANRLLPVLAPRTSIGPTAMGIGPGLPLGIGAALGTGRPTVVIHGDGGVMLSIAELATLAEEGLPLVVCVFNDGGYGILRWMQDQTMGEDRFAVDLRTPDFAALAESMGVAGTSIDDAGHFEVAFERAVHAGRPHVFDIRLDRLHPMEIRPQRPISSPPR